MNLSREGAMELIGHEAIVLTRYLDSVKVWTVGVGHTKAAGGLDPKNFIGTLSLQEVFDLFFHDVQRYVDAVNAAVKVKLSQTQFDALVSFHYNTGKIAKANLTKQLNAGDYVAAGAGFMAWVKPAEIILRRKKEQTLFVTGRYSNGGKATILPATPQGRVVWNKGKSVDLRAALSAAGA